ncbi:MAG TPA: metal-dependent hydrolase [Patescibacteria group bacterium]|nr:metal-dependent hydrolase [Patescibacteria group bacterium]
MLPPGHIAAGFLTAEALLKIAKPDLPAAELRHLLWWGVFFGFAPDLDMFYWFLKSRAFKMDPRAGNHRQYLSHAPVLWLAAGLIIYAAAPSDYVRMIGLLLWLGSWSHFLLDSIEYGIMWLWPLSTKRFALKSTDGILAEPEGKFFDYWRKVVKSYSASLSFYLELLVVLAAVTAYFLNFKF